MSEQSSYSTEIRIPISYAKNVSKESNIDIGKEDICMKIFRNATKLTVEGFEGGTIVNTIVDSDGKEKKCLTGIKTKDYPLGVGINIENGKIVFTYDANGDGQKWGKAISSSLSQNYQTIAVVEAQKELGYKVQVHAKDNQRLVVGSM